MRWSGGRPFTADDFVFCFEDVYFNKDLIPTPSPYLATNGKRGRLMKVDAFTVR
jgi:peptide/nickel transport system substrate-binding protein